MAMFGIFLYSPTGRYLLANVIGSRVYKSIRGVEAAVRVLDETREHNLKPAGGYVVREVRYVDQRHCKITPAGRVRMTIECTCPNPGVNTRADCPYHVAIAKPA